jgi:hypothetical protein
VVSSFSAGWWEDLSCTAGQVMHCGSHWTRAAFDQHYAVFQIPRRLAQWETSPLKSAVSALEGGRQLGMKWKPGVSSTVWHGSPRRTWRLSTRGRQREGTGESRCAIL